MAASISALGEIDDIYGGRIVYDRRALTAWQGAIVLGWGVESFTCFFIFMN